LHGSKLGIESQPGEGTCFYFSLPLVAIILDQPPETLVPVPRARKTPRILVIEDNEVTGQLIQSQLTSSGYETLKCAQPERATEIAANTSRMPSLGSAHATGARLRFCCS